MYCDRVCGRSIAKFAGSNPAQGMNVSSSVSVVCCAGSGSCDEKFNRSEESYWVYACLIKCDSETSRMWHSSPDLGFSTTNIYMCIYMYIYNIYICIYIHVYMYIYTCIYI